MLLWTNGVICAWMQGFTGILQADHDEFVIFSTPCMLRKGALQTSANTLTPADMCTGSMQHSGRCNTARLVHALVLGC